MDAHACKYMIVYEGMHKCTYMHACKPTKALEVCFNVNDDDHD